MLSRRARCSLLDSQRTFELFLSRKALGIQEKNHFHLHQNQATSPATLINGDRVANNMK